MKKLLTITILLGINMHGWAQVWGKSENKAPLELNERFISTAGFNSHIYYNATIDGYAIGVNFAPDIKLNPLRDKKFSLSVGSQLAVGFHPNSKNDSLTFVLVDAPLMLNFAFGHLSSRLFRARQGVVFGLGYDFILLRNTLQMGPIFNVGFRTWIGKKSVTLRYTGSFYSDPEKFNVNSISLNITLGKFISKVKRNNKLLDFMDGVQ